MESKSFFFSVAHLWTDQAKGNRSIHWRREEEKEAKQQDGGDLMVRLEKQLTSRFVVSDPFGGYKVTFSRVK